MKIFGLEIYWYIWLIVLMVNTLDVLREYIELRISDSYVGIILEYAVARIIKKAGEEDGNR